MDASDCYTSQPNWPNVNFKKPHERTSVKLPRETLCLEPRNPDKRELSKRIASFVNNWPNHTQSKPLQLAKAGLYFFAPRDRVKCWYCNGGLEDWEKFDDPWVEHAKWFPHCEFVLQEKGQEFIDDVTKKFPNIKRPLATGRGRDVPPPSSFTRDLPKVSSDYLSSEMFKTALEFGFEKDVVQKVIERKLSKSCEMYASMRELIEDCQNCENNEDAENNVRTKRGPKKMISAGELLMSQHLMPCHHEESTPVQDTLQSLSPSTSSSNASYKEEVSDENLCKICLDDDVDCVLMSCGHACACVKCATALRSCPICRAKIESIMKFYRKN